MLRNAKYSLLLDGASSKKLLSARMRNEIQKWVWLTTITTPTQSVLLRSDVFYNVFARPRAIVELTAAHERPAHVLRVPVEADFGGERASRSRSARA